MASRFKLSLSMALAPLLAGCLFAAPAGADELELVLQAGHRQTVTDAVWLDENHLASSSEDGCIKVWDATANKVQRTLWSPSSSYISDLTLTKDGLWVTQSDGHLRLWDTESGSIKKTVKLPGVKWDYDLRTYADDSGKLYAHGGYPKTYEVEPGGQVKTTDQPAAVTAMAVTPGGRTIHHLAGQPLRISDDNSSSTIAESFATRWGIDALLLDESSDTLFIGSSVNWVEAWDLKTNTLRFRVPLNDRVPKEESLRGSGYSGKNLGVSLTDYDAKSFACQTLDGEVYLIDKSSGKVSLWGDFDRYGVSRVEFSPSRQAAAGSFLGSGSRVIPILNSNKGKSDIVELGGRTQNLYSVEKEGNSLYLATDAANVLSFDLGTGQPIRQFPTGYFPELVVGNNVLYCGGNDGLLHAYNTKTGKELWQKKVVSGGARYGRGVTGLALSGDGTKLAVGVTSSYDNILLLDARTGQKESSLKGGSPSGQLLFSQDGKQLFFSRGGKLSLYDLNYRKVLHTWQPGGQYASSLVGLVNHPLTDMVVGLNRKGELLEFDRMRLDTKPSKLKLKGIREARSLRTAGSKLLIAHNEGATLFSTQGQSVKDFKTQTPVSDAAMHGDAVITTGWDSQVRFWDKTTAKTEATLLSLDKGKEWLVLAPDYHFDGSEKAQELIQWRWNGELFEVARFFERFYQPGLLAHVLGQNEPVKSLALREASLGGKPPRVRMKDPKNLGQGLYLVDIMVEGEHSGWEDVRLYHNGHRVAGKPPYRIQAMEGRNRLRASAFNKDKTVESTPHRLTFSSSTPTPKSTLHVFAAAVNDYPNPLDFAVEDAKSFAGAFEPGLYDQVKKVTLLDKKATKDSIIKALSEIECGPQDTLLVFLAGHGTIINDKFHYLPFGSNGETGENTLSSQELGQILAELPATRQVLFLDTCHAGASAKDMADLLVDKKPLLASRRGSQLVRDQKLLARQAGTFLVAGSSPSATAAEVPELGHGLFTYAVLDGLKGEQEDSEVTVNELLRYLNQRVPELSLKFRGNPQGIWQFSAGQDFPIARPK